MRVIDPFGEKLFKDKRKKESIPFLFSYKAKFFLPQRFCIIIDKGKLNAGKANQQSSRIQQSRNDIPGIMELEQGWRAGGDFNY